MSELTTCIRLIICLSVSPSCYTGHKCIYINRIVDFLSTDTFCEDLYDEWASIKWIFCLYICQLGYKRNKCKNVLRLLKSFVIPFFLLQFLFTIYFLIIVKSFASYRCRHHCLLMIAKEPPFHHHIFNLLQPISSLLIFLIMNNNLYSLIIWSATPVKANYDNKARKKGGTSRKNAQRIIHENIQNVFNFSFHNISIIF